MNGFIGFWQGISVKVANYTAIYVKGIKAIAEARKRRLLGL
jgi:hypothetical protein